MTTTVRPATVISLNEYDMKIIREYRAAKEAWDKAYETAEKNRGDDLLWQENDLAAIQAVTQPLDEAQAAMASVFNSLAKQAGV